MNLYKYKGKRIRASDKNLVYRFCVGTLLLLNMGQLMRTDWEHFEKSQTAIYTAPTQWASSVFTAEIQKVEMKDVVPKGLLLINKEGEFVGNPAFSP